MHRSYPPVGLQSGPSVISALTDRLNPLFRLLSGSCFSRSITGGRHLLGQWSRLFALSLLPQVLSQMPSLMNYLCMRLFMYLLDAVAQQLYRPVYLRGRLRYRLTANLTSYLILAGS